MRRPVFLKMVEQVTVVYGVNFDKFRTKVA